MSKELTIELGGQLMLLKFRRMTFLKYAHEYLPPKSSLAFFNNEDPTSYYQRIRAYTISGLRCAGNETPLEQLDEWIEDMKIEDAANVYNIAMEAIIGGNGQVGEQESREIVDQAT